MKSFLIDPTAKSITPVDVRTDIAGKVELGHIYQLLDCQYFDIVRHEKADFFIDDEGLYVDNQEFFFLQGATYIAGKALVFKTNDQGDTIETDLTLEQVESLVIFSVDMDAVAHHFGL